jgi:cytoskeletal protein CcmA (bactofilin family)
MRDGQHVSTADGTMNALLGPGSVVEGKLSFEGQVGIEGTFTGEISTKDRLIIGEGAKVSAEITCGSLVVKGEVTGNIRAKDSVELRERAHVKADIATPSLVIDKGVYFDGLCKMENGSLVNLKDRSISPRSSGRDRRHRGSEPAETPEAE